MENHPIPQDVTGFQFKLIGNMTIKQFAYLAIGGVIAWVLLQLPIAFLIKFPLAFFFAILGVGLAYVPVSGRPMDLMIINFIRDIFMPTQFVYRKTGGKLYFPKATSLTIKQNKNLSYTPSSSDKLGIYLRSLHPTPINKLDEKETSFFASVSTLAIGKHLQPKIPLPDKEKIIVEKDLTKTERQISASDQKTAELEKKLQEVLLQKEQLAHQLMALQQKMKFSQNPSYFPPLQSSNMERASIKRMPPRIDMHVIPGASYAANVITGIVKNPGGNPLSNILVEIKDKENNPVRAFKTNALGRFASATPLINGIYSIEFEDPKALNKFDRIQITLSGQILSPIEIISSDQREELRKSLFNPKNKLIL